MCLSLGLLAGQSPPRELLGDSKQLKQPQSEGTELREVCTSQWVWRGLFVMDFSELRCFGNFEKLKEL